MALARAYAARGDTEALDVLLRKAGLNAAIPSAAARSLALIAARGLRAHGKPREAAALFARAAAIALARGASHDDIAQHAFALYETGDYAKSKAAYVSLLAMNANDVDALGRLGTIAARAGDSASVRLIDQRLAQWTIPYSFGRPAYWRAHIAALTGRGSEAVTLLHGALAQGFRPIDLGIVTFHEDPDFLSLLNDGAFRDLMRPRVGPPVLP